VIAVIGKAKAPLILGTHGKPGQAPGQVTLMALIYAGSESRTYHGGAETRRKSP